jgi:amidase/aspartyl-tRNA(Asn)/glutamyl-tRNA(Gln) amidotransferase subunit A
VLHGVRLAVKDNTPVEGFRFTAGHTLFLNRRAPYTAPAVQLLLDAARSLSARLAVMPAVSA